MKIWLPTVKFSLTYIACSQYNTTYVTQTNSNYTLAKEGCIHVYLINLHPFPLKISNLFLNMQATTQELSSKVVKTMRPYQRHLRLEGKQKA